MRRAWNPENCAILAVTLRPSDQSNGERLRRALDEISGEDRDLRINAKPPSDELVLSGMSESYFDKICATLLDRYTINFEASAPRVLYLETVCKEAEAEGKYIRQTAGLGNYGHCQLRVQPNAPSEGYEFINEVKEDIVPKKYVEPIGQGVQSAMELGILAGYPMVDVRVTLFDGSYHEQDSNELAFRFAGSIAFKDAARKASPVLLEPVMELELAVPEKFMGRVIADINSRRGRIESVEHAAGSQVIKAIVPLKEVLSTSVRGRLDYPMQFAGYEPMPRGGWSNGDELGVPANIPRGPRPRRGQAAASPDPESE